MHIYDFITDEYQRSLKKIAIKNITTGRFEDVMNEYMKIFLSHFENGKLTLDINEFNSNCDHLKNPLFSSVFQDIHSEFMNEYKSDKENIKSLFRDFIQCYIDTIRGKRYLAVLKIFDVIEKNELMLPCSFSCINQFYRIRKREHNNEHLNEEFYYHIPFNERYKVTNQRFSISGLPLLYLGSSIASCLLEYDYEFSDIEKVGLSCWNFDPMFRMKTGQTIEEDKTKIFDITNELYDIVNGQFVTVLNQKHMSESEKENCISKRLHEMKAQNLIKTAVRKFILSQLCTFTKSSSTSSFHEEYIIPQLLTESLMMHGFNGVLYPSTKFIEKGYDYNCSVHTSTHRSNLVLFPSYNSSENHDTFLNNHFKIEVIDTENPDLSSILNPDMELDNKIKKTNDLLHSNIHLSNLKDKYSSIFEGVIRRFETLKELDIDGKNYIQTTKAGSIELINIIQYITMIIEQTDKLFNQTTVALS